jgi:hypothetical protein
MNYVLGGEDRLIASFYEVKSGEDGDHPFPGIKNSRGEGVPEKERGKRRE